MSEFTPVIEKRNEITGVDNMDIKELDIPETSGVYLMKKEGKIIYVGKAKNLKKRVTSYFNKNHKDKKTQELVKNIEEIEFIISPSELDALILENNLIKKYFPKYNIALKDEKTYPYIRITKEKFPKINIIRTTKFLDPKQGEYFGPYPQGSSILKKYISKIFKIRDCNRDMTKVYERPCLKYFMKLCDGPCAYKVQEEVYKKHVEDAKKILRGNLKIILQELETKMKSASEEMNFEEAIIYRNQISELEKINQTQFMEYGKEIDEDIFTFIIEGKKIFLEILNVRDGKILGKNFNIIELDDKIYESIFEEVVTTYYRKNTVPRHIVFSSEYELEGTLLEKWLKTIRGDKVDLFFPKNSKTHRRELLGMAFNNLLKDIDTFYKKKSVVEEGLLKLYDILELKKFPMRIECFDISNIQGKDAVASMSVAIEGRAEKKEYRKFKILTKDTPDDFQMMREVIERRYSKLEKEKFPDVILIDGGLGQINAVGKILESLGKDGIADLISIAKREEEIYKYGEEIPYIFSKSDEALKILQRVRDEAHRFGVSYHRTLRSKRVISSELDKIPGIGTKRKEKLLKKFGSVKKIRESSLEEIKEILPEKVALALLKSL